MEDITTYLKSGHNRISAATGSMVEVITDSTSLMTDADLKANALYLKDQPAQNDASAGSVSVGDGTMRAGEAIYLDNCAACHGSAGTGIGAYFPS